MRPKPLKEHPTPAEKREIRERTLDRTIEETFPASDPPSTDPNPVDPTVCEDDRDEED